MSPVDVPLNTAIADLDEGLRSLLRRELQRHGFDEVEIAFDAPAKEWSGKLTGPTVDLFLYDLREAADRATSNPREQRGNGRALTLPPPLHLELTYAVTAWTKAVEDEHRLLSQVLAILYSFTNVPTDVLPPNANGGLISADTSVGRPREEKADFWSAVGGQYKASIDYVVHITVESGATFERGPEVRSRTIKLRQLDGSAATLQELHGVGGTVRTEDGEPVPGAWIVLPQLGRWAASDSDGRFRFARLAPGTHDAVARTADGHEAKTTLTVPGMGADFVIKRTRARRSKSH
jgi:Pvc16 N-terminal domain/Carboxypeptidase regulatory-like domain